MLLWCSFPYIMSIDRVKILSARGMHRAREIKCSFYSGCTVVSPPQDEHSSYVASYFQCSGDRAGEWCDHICPSRQAVHPAGRRPSYCLCTGRFAGNGCDRTCGRDGEAVHPKEGDEQPSWCFCRHRQFVGLSFCESKCVHGAPVHPEGGPSYCYCEHNYTGVICDQPLLPRHGTLPQWLFVRHE